MNMKFYKSGIIGGLTAKRDNNNIHQDFCEN